MNPRIDIRLDTFFVSGNLRLAAYVYNDKGNVSARFDLIEDSPVIVASLGDLRLADALAGFRAINPDIEINFLLDAAAVNALEKAGGGVKGFKRLQETFATGKAEA
jgi:hypothetical protein